MLKEYLTGRICNCTQPSSSCQREIPLRKSTKSQYYWRQQPSEERQQRTAFTHVGHRAFLRREYLAALFIMAELLSLARSADGRLYRVVFRRHHAHQRSGNASGDKCQVHEPDQKQVHILMDRVCEQCHNFYSHLYPNMRYDCSLNCYNNEDFRKCLHLFKPAAPKENDSASDEDEFLDDEFLKSVLVPNSLKSALKIHKEASDT